MYNPPMLGDVNGLLGAINMGNAVGGTNWPGVAYDPETHTVFAQANNVGITPTSLVAAAGRVLRHPLRVGRRGPAVPGSARPGRLLRGRFAARDRAARSAAPRRRAQRRRPRRAGGAAPARRRPAAA